MKDIKPNNPALKSWLDVESTSDFPIQNIPFGVFNLKGKDARCGSRIGNYAIDLATMTELGYFDDLQLKDQSVFYESTLNPFIALGRESWRKVRQRISDLFQHDCVKLRDDDEAKSKVLFPIDDVEMQMPVQVGDYTDFYSSIEHATNVGTMFRDPANALLPNWKHIPVGYHGRSSSIVVSGTDIYRPKGQTRPDENKPPVFGPSKLVDFELEMAFITGKETKMGESISVENADEYIFGMVIFNDLSARDIQKWEYVPLGPFLSKNFGSVVSPWVVTLDALEPFRIAGPDQDEKVLPYLELKGNKNIDIDLEVFIQPENGSLNKITHSNFKYMYWNMNQQLAHQTVNGCNVRVGDMYGSGTISGPTPDSYGSMLELSWKGTKPLLLSDGSIRTFIEDNDKIVMKAYCKKEGVRIGFGCVETTILAAK